MFISIKSIWVTPLYRVIPFCILSCPAPIEIIKEQSGYCNKNSGKRKEQVEACQCELYQDVKPRKCISFTFSLQSISIQSWFFINSPNCFTIILRQKIQEFPPCRSRPPPLTLPSCLYTPVKHSTFLTLRYCYGFSRLQLAY